MNGCQSGVNFLNRRAIKIGLVFFIVKLVIHCDYPKFTQTTDNINDGCQVKQILISMDV